MSIPYVFLDKVYIFTIRGGEYKVSPNHPKYKTISENLAVLTEEEILSLVKITENKPPKIIE